MRAITSSTSSSVSIVRAPKPGRSGNTGWWSMRPCANRSLQTAFGSTKRAERSPSRWPTSRAPTLTANPPRLPGPATTPGHEVTSSVIRSLARCSLIGSSSRVVLIYVGERTPDNGESRSCAASLGRRRDVLVEPKQVAGVVAALDRGEPLPRGAGVGGADALLSLVAEEADVRALVVLAQRVGEAG